MLADRFSGHHTSGSIEAIAHFETAVLAIAEHRPGAAESLQSALASDPDCIAAHALNGFGAVLLARSELQAHAQGALTAAQNSMQKGRGPSASEQALVAALNKAAGGHLLEAATILEDRLEEEPCDFLALKISHALRFMGGDLPGMLRTTTHVLPAWDKNRPGCGFVMGCHAFALEEAGHFDAAESIGRQGIELEPHDAWGLHAVSHVHEMQGRTQDGVEWLEATRPSWSGCNNFAGHVAWHLALFHAEAGAFEEALSIYDRDVRPTPTEDFRDIANATSLLWRLGQQGVSVGRRWDELVEIAHRRSNETTLLFATLHHLLALLAAGEREEAGHVLASLRQVRFSQKGDQANVARKVALDLACVMVGRADPAPCPELSRIARALPCMGGSHAQRDVFMRTLALAAAHSGDGPTFERIMRLRHELRKPDSFATLAYAQFNAATRRMKPKLCV